VLPKLATPAADHPIIRAIPLVQPEIVRNIGIVRRHRAALSPGATQFLEILLEAWKS
jgi:DNA-binding transcriptional LysR family regulator